MECLYEIKGVNVLGDRIRLQISPYEKRKKLSAMDAVSDISGFIGNMKTEASIMNNPDLISIPVDEWKKHKLTIGDILTVKIEVGK